MAALVYPFLVLSAVGFAEMLVVHVASLFGIRAPFEHLLRYLAPGAFVVFLPAVLVMNQLTRDFKQKDLWPAALRGCPPWMYRTVWVTFGYVWVGFFVLPFLYGGGMNSEANKARTLSGILLAFYLVSLAALFSWSQVKHFDASMRCLNGHPVSPSANFCEECGAPVAPPDLNK